jgi:hypothetical protein
LQGRKMTMGTPIRTKDPIHDYGVRVLPSVT